MAQRRSPARKPRSSGASRSAGTRKKSGGAPGWVWLVTGLLAGLFVAFLVLLHKFDGNSTKSADKQTQAKASSNSHKEPKGAGKENKKRTDAPTVQAEQKQPPKQTSTTTVKAPATSSDSSKKSPATAEKSVVNYDFYKILPQTEVVIPEEDLHKPANAALATTPGTYYLQVGAFRKIEEADSRKAELAMLGIVTSIQTVTLEPNNSWHRVRVGPVKDMRQLDRTKKQLQENNIAFVTIKEKN
jgi:cell division protein FtsN